MKAAVQIFVWPGTATILSQWWLNWQLMVTCKYVVFFWGRDAWFIYFLKRPNAEFEIHHECIPYSEAFHFKQSGFVIPLLSNFKSCSFLSSNQLLFQCQIDATHLPPRPPRLHQNQLSKGPSTDHVYPDLQLSCSPPVSTSRISSTFPAVHTISDAFI